MIGRTIGSGRRYTIAASIGSGGMASVFEATEETTGRRVAVKTLHEHLMESERAIARFRREARAHAELRHPNIVEVLDFQANAGEPPFLVMERLGGSSLKAHVNAHGPFSPERAAHLGAQIASALEAAHAAGIVHRDVKPGNVVVSADGVKLVDFGVAMVDEPDQPRLTATNAVVGTPWYMAPEQVRRQGVDARSDVYGLGATLYFAVTGKRPFDDVPHDALARAVCELAPARVTDLRPGLDATFVAVIERAMAKRAEDRFQTAAELGAALGRAGPPGIGDGATLLGPPPSLTLEVAQDPELVDLPKPGDVVGGKLRIERVVGKGGMGIVYAARHEVLDEELAVKVLTSIPDADATARFVNEAKLAARIKSEHVCRVHDAGTLPSGKPYIAMELLAGVDLACVLEQRGPLPVAEAVDYVLQAIEAIAKAHALRIVHRDVKPSNFFLATHGSERILKVLDFGISKAIPDGASRAVSITTTGTLIGSPTYMSPEQVRNASAVDARSDIWSLGVVLFELLTTAVPFTGTTVGEVFHAIFMQQPPRLRAVRGDAPEGLELVVARCLEKEPAARFQDVAALADALAPFAPADARRSVRLERIRATLGRTESSPNLSPSSPSASAAVVDAEEPPAAPARRTALVFVAVAALAFGALGVAAAWKVRTRAHAPLASAAASASESVTAPLASTSSAPVASALPEVTASAPATEIPSAPLASHAKPRPRPPTAGTGFLDRRH